ncbi:MAG: GAP family protein [Endomicrobiales bacterium]|jgi:cytochrome c biogenesis protein CcdA
MNTLFYSLSISLFDSLSTTQQIIIFLLLLTTAKPLRNALSYLAGLSAAYFVCGFAGYLMLDELRVFLGKFFPSTSALSNPLYYRFEFLVGFLMVIFGVWYFYRKKQGLQSRMGTMFISKLQTVNSVFAFFLGIFISVTSFPVSIPYILALGKYASLHLEILAVTGYILLYNFGYALPMIVILILYLIARRETADYTDSLHVKAKMLNVHLTTWTFVCFGLFSMVDAGWYFAVGHALIKGRYL